MGRPFFCERFQRSADSCQGIVYLEPFRPVVGCTTLRADWQVGETHRNPRPLQCAATAAGSRQRPAAIDRDHLTRHETGRIGGEVLDGVRHL